MEYDDLDFNILKLLASNSRIQTVDMINKLRVSGKTIRDRIKAMERVGIIQGYTALIDKPSLGLNFFAMILSNPTVSSELDSITDKIKKVKNVLRVYQISGHHCIAIFMVAPSYKDLKEIIKSQLLPLGLKDDEIVNVLEVDREFILPLEIP